MSDEREGLRARLEQIQAEMSRSDPRFVSKEVREIVEIGLALLRERGEPVSYVTAIVDEEGIIADLDYLLPKELWAPEGDMVSVKLYASPPAPVEPEPAYRSPQIVNVAEALKKAEEGPVEPDPAARYVVVCRAASGHEVIASAFVHDGYEKAKGIRDALQRDAPSGTRYTVLPVGRARSEEGDDA